MGFWRRTGFGERQLGGPNVTIEMKNVDAACIDQIKTTVKEKLTAQETERTREIIVKFD